MPPTLYIDYETRCETSLGQHGTYRYMEDAEPLLLAWQFGTLPVSVWDCINLPEAMPGAMLDALMNPEVEVCHHNSQFDRLMNNKAFKDVPNLRDRTRCTMVRAYQHSLPGSLRKLGELFRLSADEAKEKEGKELIRLFCMPQKNRGYTWATKKTHPEKWRRFVEYARRDVVAMIELDKKIPTWNETEFERSLFQLDQKINDRGFAIDIDLANEAIIAVSKEKKILNAKTQELTEGNVGAATQRDKLLHYLLLEHGVELPNMQASTLERRLEDESLPFPVRELIRVRLQSALASVSKYRRAVKTASSDGRIRGGLQFCGAPRTGRWAGRLFQPHNLPRPAFKQSQIDEGIAALKCGGAELLLDNVSARASSCLRGVIVAPKGKKLVCADLSAIEGRKLAWLAGENWKLDAYRKLDIEGGADMYMLAYAMTFGIDPMDVTRAQRQLGKVLELALGYGGGVGAFQAFAKVYRLDLTFIKGADLDPRALAEAKRYTAYCEKEGKLLGLDQEVFMLCDTLKRMWRAANPATVKFWEEIETAFRVALKFKEPAEGGMHTVVDKKGSWARIKLPSNRYLCYPGAKVDDKNNLRYWGINPYTKKWNLLKTYSGKIAENACQAASRDVLAYGMLKAEKAGYSIVLTVHDEIIAEVPDSKEFTADGLSAIMATPPPWAPDLPLAAEGFETYRYRKG